MPLYEYKCSKCASVFEVIQKVNDPALKKCLKCGGSVFKIISPPALQFKGNGWYITDYAKKSTKESSSKEPKKSADTPANKEEKKKSPASSTS